jgi:hypothetical protein
MQAWARARTSYPDYRHAAHAHVYCTESGRPISKSDLTRSWPILESANDIAAAGAVNKLNAKPAYCRTLGFTISSTLT